MMTMTKRLLMALAIMATTACQAILVDRLDMSIPAGPTESQPKNPAAQYIPVPYIYKSQHITNRNT